MISGSLMRRVIPNGGHVLSYNFAKSAYPALYAWLKEHAQHFEPKADFFVLTPDECKGLMKKHPPGSPSFLKRLESCSDPNDPQYLTIEVQPHTGVH